MCVHTGNLQGISGFPGKADASLLHRPSKSIDKTEVITIIAPVMVHIPPPTQQLYPGPPLPSPRPCPLPEEPPLCSSHQCSVTNHHGLGSLRHCPMLTALWAGSPSGPQHGHVLLLHLKPRYSPPYGQGLQSLEATPSHIGALARKVQRPGLPTAVPVPGGLRVARLPDSMMATEPSAPYLASQASKIQPVTRPPTGKADSAHQCQWIYSLTFYSNCLSFSPHLALAVSLLLLNSYSASLTPRLKSVLVGQHPPRGSLPEVQHSPSTPRALSSSWKCHILSAPLPRLYPPLHTRCPGPVEHITCSLKE